MPTTKLYSTLTDDERDKVICYLVTIDGQWKTITEVDLIDGCRYPDEFKDVDGVFALCSTDGEWYYYEDALDVGYENGYDFGPLWAVLSPEV